MHGDEGGMTGGYREGPPDSRLTRLYATMGL